MKFLKFKKTIPLSREAGGELKTVFENGILLQDLTLSEIRDRLNV